MRVNIEKFLEESGITEAFYPGKRLVHRMRQTGEFKSHCVVLDWTDPSTVKIVVKPGLTGRDLEPEALKYYPVSFQAPTYVDIEVVNDNQKEDEDEESSGSRGGSGGGQKQKKKKKILSLAGQMSNAFSTAIEGKIPDLGNVKKVVVLGKKIAKEACAQVVGALSKQIKTMKIASTDLLAQASNLVTRYTPPAFMEPKGDEQARYKYDREKNANIAMIKTL